MRKRLYVGAAGLLSLVSSATLAQIVIDNQSVNIGSVSIGNNANVGSVVIDGQSVGAADGALQGSGKAATRVLELDNVDELIVDVPSTVSVARSDQERLSIAADSNLLEYIEATQEQTSLRVYAAKPFVARTPITLRLTVPQLTSVVVRSAADVSVEEVESPELKVVIDGTGNIEASGQVDQLVGVINGTGDLRLSRLVSKAGRIEINGTGEAEVDVSERLTASISGVGDIIYLHPPQQVEETIDGVGEVRLAASDD